MADNSRRDQKQKKSPLGGLAVFLLILLINAFSDASPKTRAAVVPALLGLLLLAAFIAVIVWASKKTAAAGGTSPERGRAFGAHPSGDSHRRAAREAFPSPDAYCLVCDQTNTDHFERDRQRRLRQLDYWLSIGLIDRKEHRALRERYNSTVPHGGN